MPQGLPRKLRRVFILQAVMASFAVAVVLYGAGTLFGSSLTRSRVVAEATDYWAGRAGNPDYPLPTTSTVTSYFVPAGGDAAGVPGQYRALPDGIHDLQLSRVPHKLLVESRPEGRLYISMSFALVNRVLYWSALASLLLAVVAIGVVSWLSYRIAHALVLPVTKMAGEVGRWNPHSPDLEAILPERLPGEVGSEVRLLGGALRGLAERTLEFVRRERDFTRDASHELRTPLTVIRVATDLLRGDPDVPERMQRSLRRIQLAGQDMETVIDAFLILAREDGAATQDEEVDVREIAWEAIAKARPLLENKPVALELVENAAPRLRTSSRGLAVMLDNLLANACAFTQSGTIELCIEADRILIRDTGIGMAPDILQRIYEPFYRADQFAVGGKGMGLSIVRRLGERFGWPVTIESAPGEGTTATIAFAAALAR